MIEEKPSQPPRLSAHGADDDLTVISDGTPLPLPKLPPGLRPRELADLLIGQQLDDFWLEEYVGGGGMGAVFRAVDTRLQRPVAVKVLAGSEMGHDAVARRFEVEAQSAARLDHPNIARVHHVGEDRGVAYIVFEYIEGENLRDRVQTHGPLTVADALNYTIQIADALLHAWQRDVVHRDIKPSNIIVTPDGHAKLVDMGLARLEHVDHADHDLTASGMTLGTFDYISPEQARSPKEADTRSDIYSLGCTLFFMLAGRPPFSGGTALKKLLQHQSEHPPSLEQIRGDVPAEVCWLVDTMLAKQIGDRFQNPAALLDAALGVAQQLGVAHHPVVVPSAIPAVQPPRNGFRRHAHWVVPVVLLVVGVAGLEYWLGQDDASSQLPPLPVASHETP